MLKLVWLIGFEVLAYIIFNRGGLWIALSEAFCIVAGIPLGCDLFGPAWIHLGHHEAEMYRPGLTFYRWPRGWFSRGWIVQWRAVLYIDLGRHKFKARIGMCRNGPWWPNYLDAGQRIVIERGPSPRGAAISAHELHWMWPAEYDVDGGIFWARWDPIEWDFIPPPDRRRLLRGESDVTRLGRWLDEFERWRGGR